MTSFTKQMRQGTGAFSRESLIEAELPAVAADEVEAVLAEPVAEQIEEEINIPAESIAEGADAVEETEGDIITLEQTAEVLSEGAEEAQDASAASAVLAGITLESICKKYEIKRKAVVSRESMTKAADRVNAHRALAKEATDTAASMKERVKQALVKIYEWFKAFVASVFDKRARLEKRFVALRQKAEQLAKDGAVTSDAAIIVRSAGLSKNGTAATSVADVLSDSAFNPLFDAMRKIADYTADKAGTNNGQTSKAEDLNPAGLAGVTLTVALQDGKFVVEKEQLEAADKVVLVALSAKQVVETCNKSVGYLAKLKAGEAELKKAEKAMGSLLDKYASMLAGAEQGVAAMRANILSRYQATAKVGTTVASIVLTTLSAVSVVCEKSLAQTAVAA